MISPVSTASEPDASGHDGVLAAADELGADLLGEDLLDLENVLRFSSGGMPTIRM